MNFGVPEVGVNGSISMGISLDAVFAIGLATVRNLWMPLSQHKCLLRVWLMQLLMTCLLVEELGLHDDYEF